MLTGPAEGGGAETFRDAGVPKAPIRDTATRREQRNPYADQLPQSPKRQRLRLQARAVAVQGKTGLAFWLLLVVYPFMNPLGTVPVITGEESVSAEFVFVMVCVVVVAVQVGTRRLKVVESNRGFLLGLALWLGINTISSLFHSDDGAGMLVFRMALKAFFGYTVFTVLMGSGRLQLALKSYVAGCAMAGLFTIAFFVKGGSIEAMRGASYTGLNPNEVDVDVFVGLARAGAGNLLPVWICIVLYLREDRKSARAILMPSLLYFAVLALLALRREVLVEAAVGMMVCVLAVPKHHRFVMGVAGLLLGGCILVVVTTSEAWQQRLRIETRDTFEAYEDPRTVLLINTPRECMASPLLGHGPGSYRWRMSQYFSNAVAPTKGGIAAHNSFSRAAVETGVPGLLGFTLMVTALCWRAARRRSRGGVPGSMLRFVAIMIFLHVGNWLFFGDGIASNTSWFFIGVLLYLDQCLLREDIRPEASYPDEAGCGMNVVVI